MAGVLPSVPLDFPMPHEYLINLRLSGSIINKQGGRIVSLSLLLTVRNFLDFFMTDAYVNARYTFNSSTI